jgi:hypothetical protein
MFVLSIFVKFSAIFRPDESIRPSGLSVKWVSAKRGWPLQGNGENFHCFFFQEKSRFFMNLNFIGIFRHFDRACSFRPFESFGQFLFFCLFLQPFENGWRFLVSLPVKRLTKV